MIKNHYNNLTKPEYKVLKFLENYMAQGEPFYWEKQSSLAHELNYDRKTVGIAIRCLETKKIIKQIGKNRAIKKIVLLEGGQNE